MRQATTSTTRSRGAVAKPAAAAKPMARGRTGPAQDFNSLHPRGQHGRFATKNNAQGEPQSFTTEEALTALGAKSLEDFQKSRGLPVTGQLDARTKTALANAMVAQQVDTQAAAALKAQSPGKGGSGGSRSGGGSKAAGMAAGPRPGPGQYAVPGMGGPGRPDARVRTLQSALSSVGFDVGSDGVYGRAMRQAVAQFQDGERLPVTGVVDLATWQRLQTRAAERVSGKSASGHLTADERLSATARRITRAQRLAARQRASRGKGAAKKVTMVVQQATFARPASSLWDEQKHPRGRAGKFRMVGVPSMRVHRADVDRLVRGLRVVAAPAGGLRVHQGGVVVANAGLVMPGMRAPGGLRMFAESTGAGTLNLGSRGLRFRPGQPALGPAGTRAFGRTVEDALRRLAAKALELLDRTLLSLMGPAHDHGRVSIMDLAIDPFATHSVAEALRMLRESVWTEALHPRGRGGKFAEVLPGLSLERLAATDREGRAGMRLTHTASGGSIFHHGMMRGSRKRMEAVVRGALGHHDWTRDRSSLVKNPGPMLALGRLAAAVADESDLFKLEARPASLGGETGRDLMAEWERQGGFTDARSIIATLYPGDGFEVRGKRYSFFGPEGFTSGADARGEYVDVPVFKRSGGGRTTVRVRPDDRIVRHRIVRAMYAAAERPEEGSGLALRESDTSADFPGVASGWEEAKHPRGRGGKFARILHSAAEGTLVHGTARGDGSLDILKRHGFRWSRSQGAVYLPNTRGRAARRHTIERAATDLRAAGFEVQTQVDEGSAAEREAARVEALTGRAEHHAGRAGALRSKADAAAVRRRQISDMIPMGQPILVGHHSEGRHRRDIARIDSSLRRESEAMAASRGAEHKAGSAAAELRGMDDPAKMGRRIATLEAEQRRAQKQLDEMKLSAKLDAKLGPDHPLAHVLTAPDEVHRERLEADLARIADELQHLQGKMASVKTWGKADLAVGDEVLIRGRWQPVVKLNPKKVAVESGVMPWPMTYPYTEIKGHRRKAQEGVVEIQERDFSAARRRRLAARGHAMPDGSFPIESAEDVANAVRLLGKASDKAAARRHIVKRAKALGATSRLPAEWKVQESATMTRGRGGSVPTWDEARHPRGRTGMFTRVAQALTSMGGMHGSDHSALVARLEGGDISKGVLDQAENAAKGKDSTIADEVRKAVAEARKTLPSDKPARAPRAKAQGPAKPRLGKMRPPDVTVGLEGEKAAAEHVMDGLAQDYRPGRRTRPGAYGGEMVTIGLHPHGPSRELKVDTVTEHVKGPDGQLVVDRMEVPERSPYSMGGFGGPREPRPVYQKITKPNAAMAAQLAKKVAAAAPSFWIEVRDKYGKLIALVEPSAAISGGPEAGGLVHAGQLQISAAYRSEVARGGLVLREGAYVREGLFGRGRKDAATAGAKAFDEAKHPRGRGGKWVDVPSDLGSPDHTVQDLMALHARMPADQPERDAVGKEIRKRLVKGEPPSRARLASSGGISGYGSQKGGLSGGMRFQNAMEVHSGGSKLWAAAEREEADVDPIAEAADAIEAAGLPNMPASEWRLIQEAADSLKKASTPEPFSHSKTSNWVARAGGLPAYIQHIAHDLMEKRGMPESRAIQMAIGIVKRWARGGGKVDANTRAAAAKAVAEWTALKARAHAKG